MHHQMDKRLVNKASQDSFDTFRAHHQSSNTRRNKGMREVVTEHSQIMKREQSQKGSLLNIRYQSQGSSSQNKRANHRGLVKIRENNFLKNAIHSQKNFLTRPNIIVKDDEAQRMQSAMSFVNTRISNQVSSIKKQH